MRAGRKTSMGAALILIVLLLPYAGSTGTTAFAQYDSPANGQYAPAPDDQYAPPPAGTTPLPENQYDAPLEDQNTTGGGDATVPADNDGDGNDGAAEVRRPDRTPSDDVGGVPEYLDGILLKAVALLGVLSLIATLFFFLERSSERPGP